MYKGGMQPRTRAQRRAQVQRRRSVVGLVTLVIVGAILYFALSSGGSATPSRTASSTTAASSGGATNSSTSAPSLEAGTEPWQLAAPLSRETITTDHNQLRILGGLVPSGASVSTVTSLDPSTGAFTSLGSLAAAVHDGGGATIGTSSFVFGGGSPNTFATVQSFNTAAAAPTAPGHGQVVSQLPQPRSDLTVVPITSSGAHPSTTSYIVGGYDGGTNYLATVLATSDGIHFTEAAKLPVPVRYPATAALDGKIYAFGGETAESGSTVTATDAIQEIDPSTQSAKVVGKLPQPLYGASAFVIDNHLYVAGGQTGPGQTLTQLYEFDANSHKVSDAGLLPQAVAFAGYATVGTGASAVGYLVGGEVANQSGPLQAGFATGTLQTVMFLRPSRYGGPVGGPSAGSPYTGSLLIADRGNDRLLVVDPARTLQWQYPSVTAPPPPGGFYFPDDAFFFRNGTGIISNQEDNHTIVEIAYPSGKLLFQYGHPGSPGSSAGYLDQPDDAYLLKSGTVTVADALNDRILFIAPNGTVTSQIGTNGVAVHNPPTSIGYPNGDTPLANGNVLVSEINGSWVTEYTQAGQLVWTVHLPTVNYPSDPQQLAADLYLIADYDPPAEGRILTFTQSGQILWTYDVTAGGGALKKPSLAEQLPNGLIMVNDDYRNRLLVIDPKYNAIVWQYGLTDTAGTSVGMLSIPDGFDLLLANGTTPTHLQTG
jgi:hypothetical protein